MTKAQIAKLFDRLAAALPEPKSELEYDNPPLVKKLMQLLDSGI